MRKKLYKHFPNNYFKPEPIDNTFSLNILKFDLEFAFMYVLHPSSTRFNHQNSIGSINYFNKVRNHLSS